MAIRSLSSLIYIIVHCQDVLLIRADTAPETIFDKIIRKACDVVSP